MARKIRVYDREALSRFYEREYPGVSIMTDWNYLEGPDYRIGLAAKGDAGQVFPERGIPSYPPEEVADRVQRALAECPWEWAEIDEPPIPSAINKRTPQGAIHMVRAKKPEPLADGMSAWVWVYDIVHGERIARYDHAAERWEDQEQGDVLEHVSRWAAEWEEE